MSRAESPLLNRMIFNFGAQRSGTFWLQRIVTAHPDVSAIPSETSLFSHGIAPLQERFQHAARSSPQVGKIYIEREALRDALRDFCDAAFEPYLDPNASFLAERTAVHVRHLGLIAEVYPDAHFIHIVRDGRDVARSLTAQPWSDATIASAADEWKDSIRAAREAGLPPDRYREVRYETLIERPREVISELYGWLGLAVTDAILERALVEAEVQKNVDGYGQPGVATGKWQRAFTPSDLADFEQVAGELLAELDYPPGEALARSSNHGTRGERLRRLARALRRTTAKKSKDSNGYVPRHNVGLGDQAIEALIGGRLPELKSMMAPNALVKVVSSVGVETQRGADAGIELLAATVCKDGVFAGRQSIGDIYPGKPTMGYVLSFELDGKATGDRAIFVTINSATITELAVYSLPLASAFSRDSAQRPATI